MNCKWMATASSSSSRATKKNQIEFLPVEGERKRENGEEYGKREEVGQGSSGLIVWPHYFQGKSVMIGREWIEEQHDAPL